MTFGDGEFGKHVKMLRQRHGWTLEKVAKKLGTHKGYVSGIENNKVNPPAAKMIRRYARIFNMSPGEEMNLLVKGCIEKMPEDVRNFIGGVFQLADRPASAAPASVAV
jgi:transcriptional regulator with XRE-family HTH domain